MQFIRKHQQKLIALSLWVIIAGSVWLYAAQNNLSPMEMAQKLNHLLINNSYGAIIFLSIYLLRPLILFPISVLTLLAGFLFGPIWGIFYGLSGAILSAMIAYSVGHYFGDEFVKEKRIKHYTNYIEQNGFEAILMMRLILLNYDFVSYLAGFSQVKWQDFLGATFLGSIAGLTAYVLAGSSLEGELTTTGQFFLPSLNPRILIISASLFGLSLAIAWYFRHVKNNSTRNKE